MPLYTMSSTSISNVPETNFNSAGFRERTDIQRLLLDNVGIISPDTLVIAEEFSSWDSSSRRIDLLGIDKKSKLVVIELKRDETGAHMDLQAIRYAAMVARMNFDQAVETYQAFLLSRKSNTDAREALLGFLELDEPDESSFGRDVRIVLVAADFSRELTTSVMWLNERDVDIRCVQLKPYRLGEQLLVNVEQVIPLREASDYQVQFREKARRERAAAGAGTEMKRYDLNVGGQRHERLYKRQLVYQTVRSAIELLNKTPDAIASVLKHSRLWASADGDLDSVGFREAVASQGLNPRRFFSNDGELVHFAGRTYAFTNQWGLNTLDAMESLVKAYPELKIEFRENTAEE